MITSTSNSPEETAKISQKLARFFIHHPPESSIIITLEGELGAGKTLFSRAFIHSLYTHLNPTTEPPLVTSPTYNILHHYSIPPIAITHIDCYRLEDELELEHIGIRDYLNKPGIFLIEWASKINYSWGENALEISFLPNLEQRVLQFRSTELINVKYMQILNQWLQKELPRT